jgi:hypothetical protein
LLWIDVRAEPHTARKRVARIGGPGPGCESGAALVIDAIPGEQERA